MTSADGGAQWNGEMLWESKGQRWVGDGRLRRANSDVRTSWRVGRIAGIEVRVDSSWVVIALLITYSMYLRSSILYPELSGGGAVGLGILATVLFFGSVLVHELAHALVSQARGIRVQDITLFLFGGATRAKVESRGPGDEFLIALVGPLTSGLLAGLFGIVAGPPGPWSQRPQRRMVSATRQDRNPARACSAADRDPLVRPSYRRG